MTLQFQEDIHQYRWLEEPDTKLTSVSTLIGYYHEKFDREAISKKTAEKRGVSQESLLAEWDYENKKSLERGTRYHKMREESLLQKKNVFKHTEYNGLKQAFDITELNSGVYPELIVYHPEYNIVGTADYIEIFEDNSFICRDWKTNKKLEFTGFPVYNPKTHERVPKKMYSPISHIHDCNGQHYSLQLSAYCFCLEEAGYTCKGLTLEHVQFDEEDHIFVVEYPLNYLKKEVKNMFEHFKSKQK